MRGLFGLMKSGFVIFGLVAASMVIGGCGSKSNPTGTNKGTTVAGMVQIPGGTFQMGSTNATMEAETGSDEEPVHSVTVSSFYMDTTLVTQASYQALMGVNPSDFNTGALAPRKPVESMAWFDAVLYCNARSKHDGYDTVYSYSSITGTPGNGCTDLGSLAMDFTKNGYRLPTEAEWEYACRAGSTSDYYWDQSYPPQTTADTAEIIAHAWWWYNSSNETQPVATKPANAWGLHDMSGNVWEWCNDWHGNYSSGSQTDPTGPTAGSYRVLRGGSCDNSCDGLCAAFRSGYFPCLWCYDWGFRCVRR
jgi:formylglycine-generating enzyme required for sulfatase activity